MKIWRALLLIVTMGLFLVACGKSEAVKSVEEAIASIGTVSYESIDKIENAEKLYEFLTDSEKERVKNRLDLVNARETYDNLPPLVPEFEDDEILALYAIDKLVNEHLLSVLKNPNSLTVNGLSGGFYEEDTYIFKLDYSAENGLGGMVREELYIAAKRTDDGFETTTWGAPQLYSDKNQEFSAAFYQAIIPKKSYDYDFLYEYVDDLWSFIE